MFDLRGHLKMTRNAWGLGFGVWWRWVCDQTLLSFTLPGDWGELPEL